MHPLTVAQKGTLRASAGAAVLSGVVFAAAALGAWLLPFIVIAAYLTVRSSERRVRQLTAERSQLAGEAQQARRLSDMHLSTIEALARAIEAKEQSPQSHIRRIQVYASALSKAAGMSNDEIEGVATAALLHDIGKLGIPEYILAKTGPLTSSEIQKMRQHPELGAAILADVSFPYDVTPLILSHHERWDGTGYPHGLAGGQIPKGARVLAVADYFDALTSERCYRKRFRWDEATAIIRHEAGRALDPALVQSFIQLLPTLPRHVESGEHAEQQPQAAGVHLNRVQAVFTNIARAHQEVRSLNDISKALASSLWVEDVMAALTPRLQPLVPFSCCALLLPDEGAQVLRCRFAAGVEAEAARDAILHLNDPAYQWLVETQRLHTSASVASLFEAQHRLTKVFKSCTLAPLSMVDRVVGVLVLFHADVSTFQEEHVRLLERVSEHTAPAIQNAVVFERTREDSLTDALTSLPNARSLLTRGLSELSHAEQQRSPLTLLLIDVDHFKAINDTHGHRAGDRALCAVARALQSTLQPSDFAARYAGDEFVLMLPGASEADLDVRLRQIEKAVNDVRFETAGDQPWSSVCVSIGAAAYGKDGVTLEALLSVADRRMYRHKARREQVERRTVSTVSTPHHVLDFRGSARSSGAA